MDLREETKIMEFLKNLWLAKKKKKKKKKKKTEKKKKKKRIKEIIEVLFFHSKLSPRTELKIYLSDVPNF